MERNQVVVRDSRALHDGAAGLARRSVEMARVMIAASLGDEAFVGGGRKASPRIAAGHACREMDRRGRHRFRCPWRLLAGVWRCRRRSRAAMRHSAPRISSSSATSSAPNTRTSTSRPRTGAATCDKTQARWPRQRDPATSSWRRSRQALGQLYDSHAHLGTNTRASLRLVPTGSQLRLAWREGRAMVTDVRQGSAAEKAGVRTGDELLALDDIGHREGDAVHRAPVHFAQRSAGARLGTGCRRCGQARARHAQRCGSGQFGREDHRVQR